jgi:hypothetical protein
VREPPPSREAFLDITAPVVASAVMRHAEERPVLVLVVDTGADEELASVLAEDTGAWSRRFAGAWSALIDYDGDIARFHLIEWRGDLERLWALPDAARELLEVTLGEHLVAVLPRGQAGPEGGDPDEAALRHALLVAVEPSEAVEGLLRRR